MRLVLFLSGLLLYGPLCSQEKGVILDSLTVPGSQNETFALYLPESYTPNSLSPIVFIFDPVARGTIGIKPFVLAAEKYDYILVCSNNSKNGPYDPNLQVANRLFNHIFSSFNIGEKRIYTAGFSGGSRLAASIAVLTNSIQGVIGCGAGFSGNTAHIPALGNTFSYVGLVGDRDMNYQEMRRAGQWLGTMKVENEIFIYEDDHRWPPPEQLLRAFGWLELQAFKKGIKSRDDNVVHGIFTDECHNARILENEGKISQAVGEYERTLRNFSSYYNLDSLAVKIKALKKSKPYKQAIKDLNLVTRLEDTLSLKYSRKFHREVALGKSEDNFKWWKKQLKKLDETYIESESDYLQKMGKRLRYQLFALAIESFNGYVRANATQKATYAAKLLDIQGPNNAFIHYRLAAGLAQLGLKEESLYHIDNALKNGWKRLDALKTVPAFNVLRTDKRFDVLLEKYEK